MTVTAPLLPFPSLRGRLGVLFMLNGLLYATWAVQIPAVQQRYHLTTTQLSGLLFVLMLGTLLALPLARWTLITRGAYVTGVLSLLLTALPFMLLGASSSAPLAVVAALLYGVGFGGMDFTLNGVGGWLEEHLAQPIMSGLHGRYSLGALVGAALGAVLIGVHIPLTAHLVAISVVMLLVGRLALSSFPTHVESAGSGPGRRPLPTLLLLLIPGFFAAAGEGTVTDWSAVYLGGVFTVDHARASLGFVAFSALMVLGRFAGDRLTATYGAARLALSATLAATTGFALITWAGTLAGTVLGFTLAGAGLSVLAPLTFSAAWRVQGSAGIALLTAVFYGGYLAGPPLTGFVIHHFQLSSAFAPPLLLAVLSGALILTRPLYRSEASLVLPGAQA